MNAPQSRVSALRYWPVTTRDRLPMALWDAASLAAAMDGAASGAFQVSGVEIDSRDVRSGDLFFALGFRATALNCMLASAHGRAHAALTDADTAAQAATHSAQLVAVVVLPATIGFSATVGFPLACLDEGILSLCRPHSPLYGESI